MRKFEEHEINEMWGNKYCAPHARFDYEKRVIKETDERLLKNVLKCCTWVR